MAAAPPGRLVGAPVDDWPREYDRPAPRQCGRLLGREMRRFNNVASARCKRAYCENDDAPASWSVGNPRCGVAENTYHAGIPSFSFRSRLHEQRLHGPQLPGRARVADEEEEDGEEGEGEDEDGEEDGEDGECDLWWYFLQAASCLLWRLGRLGWPCVSRLLLTQLRLTYWTSPFVATDDEDDEGDEDDEDGTHAPSRIRALESCSFRGYCAHCLTLTLPLASASPTDHSLSSVPR